MGEPVPVPGMAKKIWDLVRVAYFMIRKGICKKKILLDLNIMMKRRKLAGKSIRNLIFHHHHHSAAAAVKGSPRHHFDDVEEANKVVEIMTSTLNNYTTEEVAGLPGLRFKQSPMVRQLRVTDSPYPVQDNPDENNRVDQAAEDFINKFYNQLKQQQ